MEGEGTFLHPLCDRGFLFIDHVHALAAGDAVPLFVTEIDIVLEYPAHVEDPRIIICQVEEFSFGYEHLSLGRGDKNIGFDVIQ